MLHIDLRVMAVQGVDVGVAEGVGDHLKKRVRYRATLQGLSSLVQAVKFRDITNKYI